MKRSDNYAGNQVKLFLGELKNGTHVSKMKAIQHFQNYIKSYQPNISDDSVDYLYTGQLDGASQQGLLSWCGVDSEKHDGQLKRICAPLISLLKWLVTFPDDSIYYDRFVRLGKEELGKINFPKHILKNENKIAINIPGQSRSGSAEDAFELLCILLSDHRNVDDEIDQIDLNYLLKGNQLCQEKFEEWLQKSNLEHMSEALNQMKLSVSNPVGLDRVVIRPKQWSEVNFKSVPIQEGEDDEEIEITDEAQEPPPIPDPLGLSLMDLRQTQEMYSSGLLQKSSFYARRSTAALLVYDGNMMGFKSKNSRDGLSEKVDEDEDEDEEEEEISKVSSGGFNSERRQISSVIPTDKGFSVPLFLSLVHGNTQFSDVQAGLLHLKEHLQQQSRRRENLVRDHFGLFVQCCQGLEWLKDFRKGIYKSAEVSKVKSYKRSSIDDSRQKIVSKSTRSTSTVDNGMEKLSKALKTLEAAKIEAKSTLAPILERMKYSREIRSAEKVLRGISSLLEYPYIMKKALERGDYNEVISIYKRVQSIPTTSSLRIVPKVKLAAEGVVFDLKRISLGAILSPNSAYMSVIHHCNLLQELSSKNIILDALRQSFLRQSMHVLELLKSAQDKFIHDVTEAVQKGQELNIVSRNNILVSADVETLQTSITKFTKDLGKQRRRSSVKKRASFSDQSPMKLSSRGSFSTESGVIRDDDFDRLTEVEDFEAEENLAVNFEDWLVADKPGSDLNQSGVDYCEMFCNVSRRNYTSSIIEIILKWFPCLFRLSCEIYQQVVVGKSTQAEPLIALAANESAATTKSQSRFSHGTNKILASILSVVADLLDHLINGFKDGFKQINFAEPKLGTGSSELAFILAEIEQTLAFSENVFQVRLQPPSVGITDFISSNKFSEMSSNLPLFSQLSSPYRKEALEEIYGMYEAIDSAISTAVNSLLKSPPSEMFGLKALTTPKHDFDSYHEPVRIMKSLSQAGINFVVAGIFDKLMEKSQAVCDKYLVEFEKTEKSSQGMVETSVVEFESLVIKCIWVLKNCVHRPDWVSNTVHENIYKVLSVYIERLRRKAILIDESRSSGIMQDNLTTSPVTRRGRKKSNVSSRASFHQNHLILQSLEEELKYMDFGWENEMCDLKAKPLAWTDFLLACVHLRTYSIFKIVKVIGKAFALDISTANPLNSTPSTTASAIITGSSNFNSLSKLFASTNEPVTNTSQPKPKSDQSKTDTDIVGSESNGTLFDKIYKAAIEISKSYFEYQNINNTLVFPYLKEVIQVELDASEKYIAFRMNSVRSILLSYYTSLIHAESNGQSMDSNHLFEVPSHITNIILALTDEKKMLTSKFGDVTIEFGGSNRYSNDSSSTRGRTFSHDERSRFESFDEEMLNEYSFPENSNRIPIEDKQGNSRGPIAFSTFSGQKYSTFLFEQLCKGLLDCYEDLIKVLATNQGFESLANQSLQKENGKPISLLKLNPSSPRALHQAVEEYEFFKVIFRPILVDAQYLSKSFISSSEFTAILKGEKTGLTHTDLLRNGTLLSVIIQS